MALLDAHILSAFIATPFLFAIVLSLVPSNDRATIKQIGLIANIFFALFLARISYLVINIHPLRINIPFSMFQLHGAHDALSVNVFEIWLLSALWLSWTMIILLQKYSDNERDRFLLITFIIAVGLSSIIVMLENVSSLFPLSLIAFVLYIIALIIYGKQYRGSAAFDAAMFITASLLLAMFIITLQAHNFYPLLLIPCASFIIIIPCAPWSEKMINNSSNSLLIFYFGCMGIIGIKLVTTTLSFIAFNNISINLTYPLVCVGIGVAMQALKAYATKSFIHFFIASYIFYLGQLCTFLLLSMHALQSEFLGIMVFSATACLLLSFFIQKVSNLGLRNTRVMLAIRYITLVMMSSFPFIGIGTASWFLLYKNLPLLLSSNAHLSSLLQYLTLCIWAATLGIMCFNSSHLLTTLKNQTGSLPISELHETRIQYTSIVLLIFILLLSIALPLLRFRSL